MRTHLPAPALAVAAGLALTSLALTSCNLGAQPSSNVAAGSLAKKGDLKGLTATVGGKEFTEQLVLCEIAAEALESAGATVKRSCGMSGTATVRAALLSGSVDMYWEYTGTGWITNLKQTEPIKDPKRQYQAVADADLAKNSVRWLAPAPANNTYAVATTNEKAAALGVRTLSDYARLAGSAPANASFCGASEFFGRDDGWPGLQKAYGFTLPRSNVAELAAGPIYNAIDKSNPCAFGEVFATDGRIAALGLTPLTDDKKFFPVYNPALTVRKQVTDKYPQLADVLAPVAGALTDQVLRGLNAKVDVNGETPEQVARDWLKAEGFVS